MSINKRKSIRLQDVAEAAGCSIATASHVINQTEGNIQCSQELANKILSIAAELNYKPHHRTKSITVKPTRIIGVYFSNNPKRSLDEKAFFEILTGIENICEEENYNISVWNLNRKSGLDLSEEKIKTFSGIILISPDDKFDNRESLNKSQTPFIAINYSGKHTIDNIDSSKEVSFVLVGEKVAAVLISKIRKFD